MTSGALEFKSIGYYDNHLKVSIPDKCITLPKVAPGLTVTLNENLQIQIQWYQSTGHQKKNKKI